MGPVHQLVASKSNEDGNQAKVVGFWLLNSFFGQWRKVSKRGPTLSVKRLNAKD
jgi:hypothetical protein